MSKISKCRTCGGNIVEPAYPGDGAYPVPPMCSCGAARGPVKRLLLAALLAACSSATAPNTTELHFRLDAQTCHAPMPLVFYLDGEEVGRATLAPGEASAGFTLTRGTSHVIGAKLADGSSTWGPTTTVLDKAVWYRILYCTVTL